MGTAYSNLMEVVLRNRGITEENLKMERRGFHWDYLEEKSKEMLDWLFRTEGKIGILYDPDVDGLFSGYILEDYLTKIGLGNRVEHRMNKGKVHGVNDEVVQWMVDKRIETMFIVDAGSGHALIVDEAHKRLAEIGITCRTYIIDHHEYDKQEEVDGVTIVNIIDEPRMSPVSGCGVVYQVIEEWEKVMDVYNIEGYEQYVGITILSDVCSMKEPENRYFVGKTFDAIDDGGYFFKAFKFFGSKSSLISYTIVPFFNAMIRMDRVEEVLAMTKYFNTEGLGREVFKYKNIKDRQKARVDDLLEISKVIKLNGMTILIRPTQEKNYRPFNGLLANRLMGDLRQSAITVEIEEDKDYISGSFRGLDLTYKDLEPYGFECKGHEQACGVRISTEDFKTFVKEFNHQVNETTLVKYDMTIKVGDLTADEWMKVANFNEMSGKDCEKIKLRISNEPISNQLLHKRRIWSFEGGQTVVDFGEDVGGDMVVEVLHDQGETYQLIRSR